MLNIWAVLVISAVPLLALQIDYERAEQLSGFDMINTTLRVRKYNRTTKVLNGTTASSTILNNSFLV